MFKFIRKKILEGMVKDFIADMPKYKLNAMLLLSEKKDEILEFLKEKIAEALKEFFEKNLK